MASPPSLFHAFLRPSILQILRATGYHSTRPTVLDSLTDLAARYLLLLCERTAVSALNNHGDAGDFGLGDVRVALQNVGAVPPDFVYRRKRVKGEGWEDGDDDMRGMEEFMAWFAGPRMREMMEMGSGDGELEGGDYLTALKKKHSKTGDDAKFQGTIFGRCVDGGEVQVEGGGVTSIEEWILRRRPVEEVVDGMEGGEEKEEEEEKEIGKGEEEEPREMERDSRPPSSGLSSVGDRVGDDDMDLT